MTVHQMTRYFNSTVWHPCYQFIQILSGLFDIQIDAIIQMSIYKTGVKNLKLIHIFENMVPTRKEWTKDITGRVQKKLKSHFDSNIGDLLEAQLEGAEQKEQVD